VPAATDFAMGKKSNRGKESRSAMRGQKQLN
jgi:hypothetical protein